MTLAEFAYTVLLRPKPLKKMANALLLRVIPGSVRRHGAHVVLNRRDPVISGALALGVYEKAETAFFLNACSSGMTFLDIGANVGYYTALALAATRGSGRIIAMEPDPENFEYLRQTVAANSGNNVQCVRRAAAECAGRTRLFISDSNRGDNRLYPNELANGSIEIDTIAVDDQLVELGVDTVDFIKIDVQGYEGKVFAGMTNLLSHSPKLLIMSEFWPYGLRSVGTDPRSVLDGLEGYGFRLFEMDGRGGLLALTNKDDLIARTTGRKYTNIVAVKGPRMPLED
jgi:FkbM family methyltransferase